MASATKKCPDCKVTMKADAKKCPACGYKIPATVTVKSNAPAKKMPISKVTAKKAKAKIVKPMPQAWNDHDYED